MFVGLPDRECCFEEADHAAEEGGDLARIDGNETVAGNIQAVIHRIVHDQDLLQCGAFAAPFSAVFTAVSVLTESENPEYALGYVKNAEGSTVYTEEMRHCFCNALLDYSGKQKQQKLENNEKLIYPQ